MTKLTSLPLAGLSACLFHMLGVNSTLAEPPVPGPFPDGTRYAAIGDSITHNGWYAPYVDLYYLTRFPTRKLEIFNCGINGDTADGGLLRYSWDIAPHGPTVASIMFGMNDVGRDAYAPGKTGADIEKRRLELIDNYERNLRALVKTLQQGNVKATIIQPSIFDDTATGPGGHFPGLNEGLGECARRAAKVAEDTGCGVVDFYDAMLKVTQERQKTDPAFSMIGQDRVHPTVLGQLFMAYVFLKAQHAPAQVARVSLDGTSGKVAQEVNCRVDEVKTEDAAVTFRYAAYALPFPIEKWTSAVTTWAPVIEDLDQETLQVAGLPTGTYQLAIDNKPIRSYSAVELAAGVNLATENTPQMAQAGKVWAAYKQRLDSVFKLRTIACVERSAFAPALPHPATLAEMQPLLDIYLKKVVGSPWEKAIRGEVDAYRACKSDEARLRADVEKMREEVRPLAQPQPHVCKISLAK